MNRLEHLASAMTNARAVARSEPWLGRREAGLRRGGRISIFCCVLMMFAAAAQANVTISGTVKDNVGAAVAGATVQAIDPLNQAVVASAQTDAGGNYALSAAPATYDVKVTSPPGSPFGPAVAPGQAIASDTVLNFVLVPAGGAALTGRVLDPLNGGLPNQHVELAPWGTNNWISSITDALGNYSFQVAPGDYQFRVYGYNDANTGLNAPGYYYLAANSAFSLAASTTMNIGLPAKRVHVRVQSPQGLPVANVSLTTSGSYNPDLLLGGLAANGESYYPSWLLPPPTNASGEADLWLFPNGQNNTYTITAIPPPGSPWAVTNISNVVVTSDTSLTITLAAPVPFSGRLLDPLNGGLPNQHVELAPWGTNNWISSITDALGNYSFQVAPGDYQFRVYGYNDANTGLNAPGYYYLAANSAFSLAASTTMNIGLPAKRVHVRVQSPQGLPVANVSLTTSGSYNPNLLLGGLAANGESYYPSWLLPHATNSSGEADLWLYPNGPYNMYTITAVPPQGSPFVTFNVYDVAFTSDITVVVVLQFGTPPPPNACPVSQGFWKNQAEFWPVTSLTLGGQTYTKQELALLLRSPDRGDASLILAAQLIAAKLNIAWGSNPDPIKDTITTADSLLSTYPGKLPYNVKTSTEQGKKMVSAAELLDQYNNMLLTPRCDPMRPTLALTRTERDIEGLRAEVRALMQRKTLNNNQGRSLDAKLAGARINRENKSRARLALTVFVREVDSLSKAGGLATKDARRLTEKAARLISLLN
jgi:hypothetical protein